MISITPFLWFDDNAEEAVDFYCSVFKNSRLLEVSRYGEAGPGPAGSVMVASFELEGQKISVLNGGPHFRHTEAFSLWVSCETQDEVDDLWERLSEGGQISQCGWLKDRFGLSWQIVPAVLPELIGDPDPEKARRVTEAMLKMTKLDLEVLKAAHRG